MTSRAAETALEVATEGCPAQPAPSLDGLLAAHGERALRIASRIVRGDAAAEDIAQDAFVKAWRALPRFAGEAELATWLYRIVVNEALSHLRRQKLREGLARWITREPSPAPADPTLRRRVERALDGLAANERAVFTLVHLEGFTVVETAAIRGRAPGTIKSQLHRALRKLRRELASCWEERR